MPISPNADFHKQVSALRVPAPPPPEPAAPEPISGEALPREGYLASAGLTRTQFDEGMRAVPPGNPEPPEPQHTDFRAYRSALRQYCQAMLALRSLALSGAEPEDSETPPPKC